MIHLPFLTSLSTIYHMQRLVPTSSKTFLFLVTDRLTSKKFSVCHTWVLACFNRPLTLRCLQMLVSRSFSSDVQLKKDVTSFKLRLHQVTIKTNTCSLVQLADGLMWKSQVSKAAINEQPQSIFFSSQKQKSKQLYRLRDVIIIIINHYSESKLLMIWFQVTHCTTYSNQTAVQTIGAGNL